MQSLWASFVDELNGSPVMQLLIVVLVVVGRLGLDRWERKREYKKHKATRVAKDAK